MCRSSLKSPSRGDNVIASMPAASARCVRTATHRISGGIGVAGDIESAQAQREATGLRGDWPRVQRPSARSAAHSATTAWSRSPRRQQARHPLTPKRTALPSRSPIARRGVSIGALPSRTRSKPSGSSQVRCTPVIRPVEIGDAGDHRRPGFGRQMFVRPIVAAWMEAQAATMVDVGYSATLQIRLDHSPLDRT